VQCIYECLPVTAFQFNKSAMHTLAWPGTTEGHVLSKRSPILSAPDLRKETQREAPLSRAWFYQERFLSRRVVHFTKYELWECMTRTTCECEESAEMISPLRRGTPMISPLRRGTPMISPLRRTPMISPLRRGTPMDVHNRNQLRASKVKSRPNSDPWHLCSSLFPTLLTFEKDVFPASPVLQVECSTRSQLSYYAGLWLSPCKRSQ
jgi:hypothetical protein